MREGEEHRACKAAQLHAVHYSGSGACCMRACWALSSTHSSSSGICGAYLRMGSAWTGYRLVLMKCSCIPEGGVGWLCLQQPRSARFVLEVTRGTLRADAGC